MTEHRDSPGIEPLDSSESPPSPHRRFTRLVGSTAARRVAPARLLVAAGVVLALAFLLHYGGSMLVRAVRDLVAGQPDQQVPFGEIELVTEPPPWIRSKSAGLLEGVRAEAGHPRTLPNLDLDLEKLTADFKRCPWVERVVQIRKGFRHLSVQLVYRKPVAVVILDDKNVRVIDREAAILPLDDMEWSSRGPTFQVLGVAKPLILIRQMKPPADPRPGVAWKRAEVPEGHDPRNMQVLEAARLAAFLLDRPGGKSRPRSMAEFVEIWPPPPDKNGISARGFFLKDAGENWVYWDDAPGSESPGELSAGEKWAILLDWVEKYGPIDAKWPSFMRITRTELKKVPGVAP